MDIDNFHPCQGCYFFCNPHYASISLDFDVCMIDDVYVAGGIGSGINMRNAVNIGMFPDIPLEKFHYIGNSSLTGCLPDDFFLQQQRQKVPMSLLHNMTYMELSTDTELIWTSLWAACFIPHTDTGMFPDVMKDLQNRK